MKCDLFIRGRISHRMGTRGWMEWSATLGAQITSLSCFHQKGRHAESQIRSLSFSLSFSPAFISFIHSVSHSLTHRPPPSPLASFVCARVFLSRKLSLGPDDQQPTDNRQPSTSCSFVSAYISLAYNFYLLLIQLQNCSLIAHIS